MQPSAMIAMSGGVDSTVAALLALRDGYKCAGAVMKLCDSSSDTLAREDARIAAEWLGIPFRVFDFRDRFAEKVIARFIAAYRDGRTPNPCVDCNMHLKFGAFLEAAEKLGYGHIVTGHYARIERGADGRFLLKKGADESKDQSYVLYSLTQSRLSRTVFPLGGLSKAEVRELAALNGLQNAERPESQDICFVPDGDYAAFIEQYTGVESAEGRFVDQYGGYLGPSKGVNAYTIGQRRGLGLAMPYPAYVLELRPEDGTVVVGPDELLYSKQFLVREINLIALDCLAAPLRARVKIRYSHREQPATVTQTGPDELCVEFDVPQRAITKGQAAVIYDGDIVIGGGTICAAGGAEKRLTFS